MLTSMMTTAPKQGCTQAHDCSDAEPIAAGTPDCKSSATGLQLAVRYFGAVQQYRGHEHSRESIELAYDRILQEKMNVRHKHGFKPVRTGRKTDVQGDAEVRISFSSGDSITLHPLDDLAIQLTLDTSQMVACSETFVWRQGWTCWISHSHSSAAARILTPSA